MRNEARLRRKTNSSPMRNKSCRGHRFRSFLCLLTTLATILPSRGDNLFAVDEMMCLTLRGGGKKQQRVSFLRKMRPWSSITSVLRMNEEAKAELEIRDEDSSDKDVNLPYYSNEEAEAEVESRDEYSDEFYSYYYDELDDESMNEELGDESTNEEFDGEPIIESSEDSPMKNSLEDSPMKDSSEDSLSSTIEPPHSSSDSSISNASPILILGRFVNASMLAKNQSLSVLPQPTFQSPTLPKESRFISSGYWDTIDKVTSLGFSASYPQLRISRRLRSLRKTTARVTGLHGAISKKGHVPPQEPETEQLDDEALTSIRRRIAAIERARQKVQGLTDAGKTRVQNARQGRWKKILQRRRQEKQSMVNSDQEMDYFSMGSASSAPNLNSMKYPQKETKEHLEWEIKKSAEETAANKRVVELDEQILAGQDKLLELQIEKDLLQQRPNPLCNYTNTTEPNISTRVMNFPSPDLVDDYIAILFESKRLVKLNHTKLWRTSEYEDQDEESIRDDLPPQNKINNNFNKSNTNDKHTHHNNQANTNGNGNGGGSWLLRQTIGKNPTLGEKLGQLVEVAAYKSVCTSVMCILARSISAIHGVNVMAHSDIRLYMEDSPDLPTLGNNRNINYAQQAIAKALKRGVKAKHTKPIPITEQAFLQRDAVVETLISHCQISAPLLKLFPLAWQRALISNVVTLITSIVSDFASGIRVQILGHQLSLSFTPITEFDMLRHLKEDRLFCFNRAKPEDFEAAVSATARDISSGLTFLDRWHERALGGALLRSQVANLIARIVLTMVDEILCGAKFDLWSAQAGGPTIHAGLEYRTKLM